MSQFHTIECGWVNGYLRSFYLYGIAQLEGAEGDERLRSGLSLSVWKMHTLMMKNNRHLLHAHTRTRMYTNVWDDQFITISILS